MQSADAIWIPQYFHHLALQNVFQGETADMFHQLSKAYVQRQQLVASVRLYCKNCNFSFEHYINYFWRHVDAEAIDKHHNSIFRLHFCSWNKDGFPDTMPK